MYHVNPYTHKKGVCQAQEITRCRWYGGEENTRHYQTAEEAEQACQQLAENTYGQQTLTKNIEYSFSKKFQELEKTYNETYHGLPTSFLKKDLYDSKNGYYIHPDAYSLLVDKGFTQDEADSLASYISPKIQNTLEGIHAPYNRATPEKTIHHLMTAVSTPQDMQATHEEIQHNLAALGFDNIRKVDDDSSILKMLPKASKAYIANINNERFIITDENVSAGKVGARYRFKYKTPEEFASDGIKNGSFQYLDTRKVVALNRIQKLTNENLANTLAKNHGEVPSQETLYEKDYQEPLSDTQRQTLWNRYQQHRSIGATFRKLNEKQQDAHAFQQQKRFITEQKNKIATVWTDKKNPDKTRQEMMKKTPLNNHFKKVEIDNDVEPEEMAQFEKDYQETINKLPPIDNNRKPTLRIRKLGKHKATGLYSANLNTIAIDVRDSSAFIHEYGHYLDLTVKDSQSTHNNFRNLRQAYTQHIRNDNAIEPKQKEYYTTPTEIHSRMFEVYAYEKLGIHNKLINPQRFSLPEYQPIHNPELKKKTFEYFDTVFS